MAPNRRMLPRHTAALVGGIIRWSELRSNLDTSYCPNGGWNDEIDTYSIREHFRFIKCYLYICNNQSYSIRSDGWFYFPFALQLAVDRGAAKIFLKSACKVRKRACRLGSMRGTMREDISLFPSRIERNTCSEKVTRVKRARVRISACSSSPSSTSSHAFLICIQCLPKIRQEKQQWQNVSPPLSQGLNLFWNWIYELTGPRAEMGVAFFVCLDHATRDRNCQ